MKRTNFAKSFSNKSIGSTSGTSSENYFGRVVDIILDENHPEYLRKGGLRSLYGAFYITLGGSKDSSEQSQTRFAYWSNSFITKPPVPGELIRLEQLPVPSDQGFSLTKNTYYTSIINIWNSPNTSTYLNAYSFPDQDISQDGVFQEKDTLSPLQPLTGDVIIQGRQGQSIRFTGVKYQNTPWEIQDNSNYPLTIISNGQKQTEDGFTPIYEDINQDPSSIYLTEKQKIPLSPASTRYKTYDNKPESISEYINNQIILNSGRTVINSYESDILLSSTKSIGLDSKQSINIESDKYICLDSETIFIGERARTSPQSSKEPALLGHQVESFLESIINILDGMAQDMANAATVDGKPVPLLNKRGIQSQATLQVLRNRINPNGKSALKSNKLYIE